MSIPCLALGYAAYIMQNKTHRELFDFIQHDSHLLHDKKAIRDDFFYLSILYVVTGTGTFILCAYILLLLYTAAMVDMKLDLLK